MLAIPERVTGPGGVTQELIWHKPKGRGDGDFQPIACSDDEGITLPWGKRDISLRLDKSGERWCEDCLKLIRAAR